MRADVARAERFHEVRAAASAWAREGAIDGTTLAAVAAAYPDDRARLGPALRALAFVLAFLAAGLLLGFFGFLLGDDDTFFPFLFVYGLALAALADWQVGPLRRAQGGTETATAWAAATCLVGFGVWALDEADLGGRTLEASAWLLAGATCAAAAWRFGGAAFAGAAGAGLLLCLSRLDAGRGLVAIAGSLVLWAGLRFEGDARLAPSHRAGARALQWVGAAGLYLAVHLGSWDTALFEGYTARAAQVASPLRPLSIAATALVPVALLAAGVARRRRTLLLVGAAALVASLVTIRAYVHVAPLFVVLVLSGSAALFLSVLLERWLRRGRDQARGGFTAAELFEDERRLRAVETALAATQVAPTGPVDGPRGGLEGGGGESGGGGASERF